MDLLTNKYRPSTFEDVIGNKDIIKSLSQMTEEKDMPHLLFYGAPGTGKTTSAKIIASKYCKKENILELNASNDRGINIVRNDIKNFSSRTSESMKLIILDECDSMTIQAQQALRRIMETHTKETRFILICNNFEKVFEPLQSRCSVFKFEVPSNSEIREKVNLIIKKEGFEIENAAVDLMVDNSYGDMRQVLNNLQNAYFIENVTFGICLKILGIPSPKIIQKILNLLKKGDYERSATIFSNLWSERHEPTDLISTFFREAKKDNDTDILKIICKYQLRILSGLNTQLQFLAMFSEISDL